MKVFLGRLPSGDSLHHKMSEAYEFGTKTMQPLLDHYSLGHGKVASFQFLFTPILIRGRLPEWLMSIVLAFPKTISTPMTASPYLSDFQYMDGDTCPNPPPNRPPQAKFLTDTKYPIERVDHR